MDNTFKEVDERIEAFFNDSSNYDEYSDYSDCCGECGGDLLIENVKAFIHQELIRARNEVVEEAFKKGYEVGADVQIPLDIISENGLEQYNEVLSSLKRE